MDAKLNKLNRIANLHNTHEDFDGVIAHYTGKLIAPLLAGLKVLEAGCSTGVMTPMILEYASSLDIVEGSPVYAEEVAKKYGEKIKMTCSLFEDFEASEKYDAVVFANVLHHLNEPVEMLEHIATWVKKGGKVYISVPNMLSFHRELGVAMKISESVYQSSERNKFFEQPGRYDKQKLIDTVKAAGLNIVECYGFLFKPFPHSIMNNMQLKQDVLDGLFEMGIRYPDLACQLFVKAQKI